MNDSLISAQVRERPAERWLRQARELALSYSLEVQGNDPEANGSDVTTLHLAAATLWRTSGGAPCWSKFDPDAFRDDLERSGLTTFAIEAMQLTVHTLYCYLARHGLLSPALALAAQDRIVPHVRDLVRRLVGDDSTLAGHPALAERGAWSAADAAAMLN